MIVKRQQILTVTAPDGTVIYQETTLLDKQPTKEEFSRRVNRNRHKLDLDWRPPETVSEDYYTA